MINQSVLAVLIVFLTGSFSVLLSQDNGPDGAPRLTPEERRERWGRMRGEAPEDQRARLAELRENRLQNREEPVTDAASVSEAEDLGENVEQEERTWLEQLQFRSILTLDGTTEFRLHDPVDERTFSVSENEGRAGVEVVSFDSEQNALTIRHEGKERQLFLERARVAELTESDQMSENEELRRQRWQQWRERMHDFREKWDQAKADSPELQEIEVQYQELGADFRRTREALRNAEEGSEEHRQLQVQQREMREEFRLLSEYSLLELQKHSSFEPEELQGMQRMMGRMMNQRGGGGNRGNRWGGRGAQTGGESGDSSRPAAPAQQ